MDSINNKNRLSEEKAFEAKLKELKRRLNHLCEMLPCLRQCSHLSNLLQEVFELREGINQLEKGLLQTHLKCCISSKVKIPEEVVLAVSKLSARRHGAIIVIEQENTLDDYFQGGINIDAVVSAPILESLFYPGSQLHDGAVLIRDARVIKAGCLLPFAPISSGLETLNLGTRHEAAVGLSGVSDALAIVVSEEKGWISLALDGQLYPNIGTFALLQKLGSRLEKGNDSNP